MPRYRFDWSNHDGSVLRRIAKDLGVEGEAHEELRRYYGARPKVDFVRDAWVPLIDGWLSRDRQFAGFAAERLRERGVGDISAKDDMTYLRSVRNTSGSRQVLLELFIERGEASAPDSPARRAAPATSSVVDVTQAPPPPTPSTPSRPRENRGGDEASLRELVVSVLVAMLGTDDLFIDGDGDFVVPSGSAIVYVSVLNDPALVRVFSVTVAEVPENPAIFKVLNDINVGLRLGRFAMINDVIVLEHYLLPMQLSGEELMIVINAIRHAADHFDHRLQQAFGGKTSLPERAHDEIDV